MDCSAFRRHHVAYVDDTLPGDLLVAAVRHAAECPACARHDTGVRRSLLLARNICGPDRLECSPDFAARLEARLRREGADADRSGLPADDWTPTWRETFAESLATRLPAPRRARQALAAAAVVAAASTGALLRGGEQPSQVQGLGGGPLTAAAFDSPFTPMSVSDLSTGGDAPFETGFRMAGTSDVYVSAPSAPAGDGTDGPTFAASNGAVDAGAFVAPAAVGVPVWAAAVLAGEMPAALWRADSGSGVGLVRMGH